MATSKALYGFDDRIRQMILLGVLRGLSVGDALKEEELRILREEIDPDRAIIGAAGE